MNIRFVLKFLIISFFLKFGISSAYSDNHNVLQILEALQQDIKTLERAVYSNSFENNDVNNESGTFTGDGSEEALTRHLLKLSEIENQFRDLTNKFEEINFKLDKLSNRVTKLQSDNQIRFQDIENDLSSVNVIDSNQQLSSAPKIEKQILPGSSQPQDLGAISYKDMETSEDIKASPISQEQTDRNVNIAGGKDTDKREESARAQNRGNQPSANATGDRA